MARRRAERGSCLLGMLAAKYSDLTRELFRRAGRRGFSNMTIEGFVHRIRSHRDGISIVEVVVALLCFSITITALTSLTLTAKESGDVARDHYVAVNLAKNRLERAKSFGFTQLSLFAESDVIVDNSGAPSPNGRFRRTTTISNVSPTLVEINVNVETQSRTTLEYYPGAENVKSYVTDIAGAPSS